VARSLPEGSLYAPIEAEYKRRQTHAQEGAMSNEEFARRVVAQLEGRGATAWLWPWGFGAYKKWIWEGNKAGLVWLLSGGWTWSGVFDGTMRKTFGLDRLGKD